MEKQELQEFIYFFTHNKKLTRTQQKKRNELLARDVYMYSQKSGEAVTESAPKTEDHTKIEIEEKEDNKKPTNQDSEKQLLGTPKEKVKYIPPKNLHEFLYRFNQDSVLKYTCHEIDTDDTIKEICQLCKTDVYSLKKHSELILKAFEKLNKELIRDKIYKDSQMYAMMSVYLTGKTKSGQTKWSSLNIHTNWASKELLEWGNNNPGIVPSPGRSIAKKQKNNGYELPKALQSDLSGNRILAMKELVIYFKSLFHIRRDNSLRDILHHINEVEKYSENNIRIIYAEDMFKSNIELLTNVDKIIQAYKHIVAICKSCHKEGDLIIIELSFYEEDGNIYFCVHDKNSVYGKNLDAATKRIGEAHSKLIKNQINGLCEFYIEADFDNQEYARIALWHANSHPLGEVPNIEVKRLDNCQGVKYILKF